MTISSSSPSSASSCPSYTNVTRSDNSLSSSCIPKILRRLVCGSNLYIQTSDFTEEVDGFDALCSEDKMLQPKINASSCAASPGLVARLMGLESMPEFPRKAPESIKRSRSVNSVSSWAEIHPAHRRVGASMSFREVPTFLRQENQDFLLLSFGTDGGEECLAMGQKKSELGFGDVKERRVDRPIEIKNEGRKEKINDRCRSRESERRNRNKPSRKARDCSIVSSESRGLKKETDRKQRRPVQIAVEERSQKHMHLKKITDGAELGKKKNRKKLDCAAKKTESECSSENSSPVSVLDRAFDVDSEFLLDCDHHKSGRLRSSPLNSRRKLSSGLPNLEYPFLQMCSSSTSSSAEIKSIEEGDDHQIKSHKGLCSSELWHETCQLAEEDAKKADWAVKIGSRTEEVQEIGIEFSLRILNAILQEAIDELAELPQHQYCKL